MISKQGASTVLSLQIDKGQEKVQTWQDYANISVTFGDDPDAEMRIAFQANSGSWPAIGNYCLVSRYFPAYQHTMNFGRLMMIPPDTEYERTVVHEWGMHSDASMSTKSTTRIWYTARSHSLLKSSS